MPFTDTSRNIRLDGSTLIAECKLPDGKTYKSSSISLDTLIGNVDGSLRWGYKGFSQTSRNIRLEGSQLTAEVKGSDGKWIPFKLDLNAHIHNNRGVLEGVHIPRSTTPRPGSRPDSIDIKQLTESPSKSKLNGNNGVQATGALASALSTQSSIASSASSMFSSSSSMSSSTSIESHTTTKTFSESSFRSHSMQMSVKTTCTNLILEGSLLWADCLLMDGVTIRRSSIDLDSIIGYVDGRLVWGATGLTKSKSVRNIRIVGFILIAEIIVEGGNWIEFQLDLNEKLKNKNGALIAISLNADLSVMLSEIPWMKFKVIAEPDLSVFARHPVMHETMTRIAESTVEHVTLEMSSRITTAIQQAISVVTASAMRHVSESLETMVGEIGAFGTAHGSATASGELRLTAGAEGHIRGGAYFNGGGQLSAGGQLSGGFYSNGGSYSASAGQLTGGAMLSTSSGSFTSSSESHSESGYFASDALKAGKTVTTGRTNQIVEMTT